MKIIYSDLYVREVLLSVPIVSPSRTRKPTDNNIISYRALVWPFTIEGSGRRLRCAQQYELSENRVSGAKFPDI